MILDKIMSKFSLTYLNWPKIVSTFKLVMKKDGVNENSVQSQAIRGGQFKANLHIYSLN